MRRLARFAPSEMGVRPDLFVRACGGEASGMELVVAARSTTELRDSLGLATPSKRMWFREILAQSAEDDEDQQERTRYASEEEEEEEEEDCPSSSSSSSSSSEEAAPARPFARPFARPSRPPPPPRSPRSRRSTPRPPARGAASSLRWLETVAPACDAHMGAENLGVALYALCRFVKPRSALEIGGGYTTPWVLQALKDNDEEVRALAAAGAGSDDPKRRPRVAGMAPGTPWYIPETINAMVREPAGAMHCVDDMSHAFSTAGTVRKIAARLGAEARLPDARERRVGRSAGGVPGRRRGSAVRRLRRGDASERVFVPVLGVRVAGRVRGGALDGDKRRDEAMDGGGAEGGVRVEDARGRRRASRVAVGAAQEVSKRVHDAAETNRGVERTGVDGRRERRPRGRRNRQILSIKIGHLIGDPLEKADYEGRFSNEARAAADGSGVAAMGKNDFMTPKGIANAAKARGLQEASKFFCQPCQKQCRDETVQVPLRVRGSAPPADGDLRPEPGSVHQRVQRGVPERFPQPDGHLASQQSRGGERGVQRVHRQQAARAHEQHALDHADGIHQAPRARGHLRHRRDPQGWFITYRPEDKEEMMRQASMKKRERATEEEEERNARLIREQIARATPDLPESARVAAAATELSRDEDAAALKLSISNKRAKMDAIKTKNNALSGASALEAFRNDQRVASNADAGPGGSSADARELSKSVGARRHHAARTGEEHPRRRRFEPRPPARAWARALARTRPGSPRASW